jgi:signal recognition particle subunit SRP19
LRKEDEILLWPVYFDSTRTRAEGRRVPKRLCKPSPTIDMIAKALEDLGLSYRLVSQAAHPHLPWKKTGVVPVKNVGSKNKVLRDVANKLSGLSV